MHATACTNEFFYSLHDGRGTGFLSGEGVGFFFWGGGETFTATGFFPPNFQGVCAYAPKRLMNTPNRPATVATHDAR
jgi:hypothetical protein